MEDRRQRDRYSGEATRRWPQSHTTNGSSQRGLAADGLSTAIPPRRAEVCSQPRCGCMPPRRAPASARVLSHPACWAPTRDECGGNLAGRCIGPKKEWAVLIAAVAAPTVATVNAACRGGGSWLWFAATFVAVQHSRRGIVTTIAAAGSARGSRQRASPPAGHVR